MIRINLLAVERGAAQRSVMISAAHRITIAASLILLGTVLVIGWWFWSLRQQSQRVDEEIARADQETQQIRSVLAQVQRFESRKAQLQQRVTLIEQLRRGQTGPVHIVDEISRAVPDRLWLTELTQKGDDITIVGMTNSLTAVSDFVGNLETSSWFKRPIDIIDSQMASDPKTGELVKFSVKATFTNPEAPAPASAPAAAVVVKR